MYEDKLKKLLNEYKTGELDENELFRLLKLMPFEDLGWVSLDHHRAIRSGYPEVIYCAGKTPEQVAIIAEKLISAGNSSIMATRADISHFEAVQKLVPDAVYHGAARMITVCRSVSEAPALPVCVVTAGTSDIPVAEEAAVTAEQLGNRIERVYDVGVAGIHRLFARLDTISSAGVVIVIAGMEGALASVIGGLVDIPIIAVPTSVGYGANFNGLTPLLAMLNSCAAGVGVVNIDNGFGAGWMASRINRMVLR